MNELLDEMVTELIIKTMDKWERHLKLFIRPKPKYMPDNVYRYMLRTVLYQTEQSKYIERKNENT